MVNVCYFAGVSHCFAYDFAGKFVPSVPSVRHASFRGTIVLGKTPMLPIPSSVQVLCIDDYCSQLCQRLI